MFNYYIYFICINIKMEPIKEGNNQSNIIVEVSIELIKSVRNVIEVTNERIKWKTEELLPIGILIQQLDNIIKEND